MAWEPGVSAPVTITVDPVVVVPAPGPRLVIDGRDVTTIAATPVKVDRGRDLPGDGFQPATLTATLRGQDVRVRRGSSVAFHMNAPASDPTWQDARGTWAEQTGTWGSKRVTLRVFIGTVTDRQTVWVAVEPGEWDTATRITATDAGADLANLMVGADPWPAESITDRVLRICQEAGVSVVVDPCPQQVAARDGGEAAAAQLLDQLAQTASHCGGVYVDPYTGAVRFMTDVSRQGRSPDLVLTSADVLDGVALVEGAADLVNAVTVTYVDPTVTGGLPEARARVAVPTNPRMVRHEAITTELTDAGDAQRRADSHVSHFSRAVPRITDVVLPSQLLPSRSVAEWVLTATPNLRLQLRDLPAPADPPVQDGYVEGWQLECWHDRYTVSLGLSPAVWSGRLLAWDELDPARTWADVDPACLWYETADGITWRTGT